MADRPEYQEKKAFYEGLLTIYGRKPVLEALKESGISAFRLHLAEENRPGGIMDEILDEANKQNLEVRYHSRLSLSRISRNRKQDQGVALDIEMPAYRPLSSLDPKQSGDLIAVENVTNPQNVGMIIRSVGASPCRGLILPRQGCAQIDSLVIKASAGTALKVPIFYCEELWDGLLPMKDQGYQIVGLAGEASDSLQDIPNTGRHIFVLGNETHGLTESGKANCDTLAKIALHNGVESLNVSIAAALVAFRNPAG